MDWSRAKNIMIYAFLLLNIVLGYQLWQEVRDQMHSELDWTSLSDAAKKMMEVKKIQVTAKIPSETPALREITYRFLKRGDQLEPLKQPQDTKIVFAENDLIKSLQGDIPHIEMYRYDPLTGRNGTFVLHQRLPNGLPIFEVTLELAHSQQKIQGFRQQYVELIEAKESKEQKILPASQALEHVILSALMSGAVVKNVQLGYHGQIFDAANTQVAAPSWRILLENDEVYYVNAISGAIDTPQEGKKENDR